MFNESKSRKFGLKNNQFNDITIISEIFNGATEEY